MTPQNHCFSPISSVNASEKSLLWTGNPKTIYYLPINWHVSYLTKSHTHDEVLHTFRENVIPPTTYKTIYPRCNVTQYGIPTIMYLFNMRITAYEWHTLTRYDTCKLQVALWYELVLSTFHVCEIKWSYYRPICHWSSDMHSSEAVNGLDLQTFIGLANYPGRFTPHLTIVSTTLRDVCKTNVPWKTNTL